jgi:hypothetical protein
MLTKEEQRLKNRAYHLKWRIANREHVNRMSVEWNKNNRDKKREISLKYTSSEKGRNTRKNYSKLNWKKFKLQIYAKNILHWHLKRGEIKKLPCAVCGSKKVSAHHPDYAYPLKVIWLCHVHHNKAHGKLLDK